MDTHGTITLYVGVSTYWRCTGAIDTNHAHQQEQIGNHRDIVITLHMLSNTHAPSTNRCWTIGHEFSEIDNICLRNTATKCDV